MGKEWGQTPTQVLGWPRTLDALALDQAVFWASRAEELDADTRRTLHRDTQQNNSRPQPGWNGRPMV